MALEMPRADGDHAVQALRPGTHDVTAYTGTAGASDAIPPGITVVRVLTTTDAYVRFGATATSTTGFYMNAETPEYFRVIPGEIISALKVTDDGNLHVTYMS